MRVHRRVHAAAPPGHPHTDHQEKGEGTTLTTHRPRRGLPSTCHRRAHAGVRRRVPSSTEFRLGWHVNRIVDDADAGAVLVCSEDGRQIRCRRCVVTVPLGVLQANEICFEPRLSAAKQRAIDVGQMAVYNKVRVKSSHERWFVASGAPAPPVPCPRAFTARRHRAGRYAIRRCVVVGRRR